MRRYLLGLTILVSGAAAQETIYRDPGLKTVVQVAIVCKDIEATTKRWAELLGVEQPTIRTTRPGREVKLVYRGRPSDARVKMAFLRMGQVVLEFLEPVGGPSSWSEHLEKYGEGVQHLGFQVQDLERSLDTLKRMGVAELHRGRYDSDNGTYVYMDSKETLGVVIELLHSDPPRKTR
ncbi:MAG: VOC family protein [Bryobacterales bacterium]|nr:VOC family protein [Bryobacteraceae bacterium]MDW8131068.1 VOC family protein [Bryobacterales bacterium]